MTDWAAASPWGATTADDEWEDVAATTRPSSGATAPSPPKPAATLVGAAAPGPAPKAQTRPKAKPKPTSDDALASARRALAAAERRVLALTRECDALRAAAPRPTTAADVCGPAAAAASRDKDRRIEEVLAEGEALSVKIAEREAALRGARATIRERDAEVEALRDACSAAEAKVEAAAAKNRTLETSEKAAMEGKEAAERRLRQIESDLRSKSSSSAALEAARSQLEALRKSHAAAIETQTMRLRAERDSAVEVVKTESAKDVEVLNKTIAELRAHLSQVTENSGWKEDQLRREAAELRARAESLEARNEELAEAVPGATRPLLRQVEALQAAAAERARASAAIERSQRERLQSAEASVAAAIERERAADARIGTLLARIASLEEQVKLANADAERVSAELRDAQAAKAMGELAHRREMDALQVSGMKTVREKEALMDELSKARASHLDDSEAADERERVLRDKASTLEARIEQLQSRLSKQVVSPSQLFSASNKHGAPVDGSSALRMSESMTSLLQGSNYFSNLDDSRSQGSVSDMNVAGGTLSPRVLGNGMSGFTESSSAPGGVYDNERLHSSLRARIGEIASLQAQLTRKEKASQALADEVVALTTRVEELSIELKDAPNVREDLQELKHRHDTLLVLLGEREERIQELEADLSDVNQMYKEQITDLLLKLEAHA